MSTNSTIQDAELETKDKPQYIEARDGMREFFETIAFVVFLVLLLKIFVAEAYVIPTGSMATTLLGEHMRFTCSRCSQEFVVNAQQNQRQTVPDHPTCPNCAYLANGQTVMAQRGIDGGDKVIVLKPLFDFAPAQRHDTSVFKFPGKPLYLGRRNPNELIQDGDAKNGGPQKDFSAQNYIKRLIGLPGEKLTIWYGDVYLVEKGTEEWKMIRKAPDKILKMRRLVNDNDKINPEHTSPLPTSWQPDDDMTGITKLTSWQEKESGKSFTCVNQPQPHWIRFQNVVRRGGGFASQGNTINAQPELITDFIEYNDGSQYWNPVSDLLLEAEVNVNDPKGKLTFEINAGVDQHQAIFDISTGKCELVTFREGVEVLRKEATTKLTGKVSRKVRFCNFDQRLTIWVDGSLPFGDGVELPILKDTQRGPRLADLYPASIGAVGCDLTVKHISLWRDIYYTKSPGTSDHDGSPGLLSMSREEFRSQLTRGAAEVKGEGDSITKNGHAAHLGKRRDWLPYYPSTITVGEVAGFFRRSEFYPKVDSIHHPSDRFNEDEYFMMGDNSPSSSDSRDWGQVPKHMLLGKAVWVYWPYYNFSLIR